MIFLKILFQPNVKKKPLYEQIFLKNYIVGESGYSFAIPYSPQSFNTWLMDDQIFRIFIDSTVKQLMLSNHKFLKLINMQGRFNLTLVDCKIKDTDIHDLLEGEDLNSEIIEEVIQENEYSIMQLHFRTQNHYMVTLKSNGVLGIDTELSKEEIMNIKELIDFISFGPVMLV